MQSLTPENEEAVADAAPKIEPAPADTRREPRKKRSFWRLLRRISPLFWVGIALTALLAIALANWTSLKGGALTQVEAWREAVISHPEFSIKLLDVSGHREVTLGQIAAAIGLEQNSGSLSSLEFDAAEARAALLRLRWVEEADVSLDPAGVLRIRLTERQPAAIWHAPHGYYIIDDNGVEIMPVEGPGARRELPLLIGLRANTAVAEAHALLGSLDPKYAARIRGLVRRGGRRWDALVEGRLIVKLPETEPLAALKRVFEDGMPRKVAPYAVSAIDLRRPGEAPVLRLESGAADMRLNALDNLRNSDR